MRLATFALISSMLLACSRPPTEGSEPAPVVPIAPLASGGSEREVAPAQVVGATPPRCDVEAPITLFVSPKQPAAGRPTYVVAVSEAPLDAELSVHQPGKVAGRAPKRAVSAVRRGGPPYFWLTTLSPELGALDVQLTQPGCAGTAEAKSAQRSLTVEVTRSGGSTPRPPKRGIWPTRRYWSREWENLYSAWIEALFDAPDDESPSWSALYEVLRDPSRNFLFDYLGAREDSVKAPKLRPDCADLPYFMRAYFAWKLRLPFGIAECSRGGGGAPPVCRADDWASNESLDERAEERKIDGAVASFESFSRGKIADVAHSSSARTLPADENSDYYPVPISWESLRPGTVYADPYGHILMISKRVPQTQERGGILFAVDGQPDGTVGRKRFWRGNFLYANDVTLGGPGFKRFRPIRRRPGSASPEAPLGELSLLSNAAIAASADYADLSAEAGALSIEDFYDAMDDALSPVPRDASVAMKEAIVALDEQVRARVVSVENGRSWQAKNRAPVAMPEGPAIFETTGAWEDFATPSRDLRLLIALDVVAGFPAKVQRRPERFGRAAGAQVQAELEQELQRELAARSIRYLRSDGSSFELSLAEVLARRSALEMAYNLNDCVEVRWGAKPGSAELATCERHAPSEQRAQMERARTWFAERKRPPRRIARENATRQ